MVRDLATFGVFAGTMVLVLRRAYDLPEALWTCLGASLLLGCGWVTLQQARVMLEGAAQPLLFLAALLLLAALIERSGFFEWVAHTAAHRARGDGAALYRNVFLLGALITAVLSLDTTAVILTPIVLALVRRLRLPAPPFVFACAFVANVGSLALPVSNLTNLLFVSAFKLSFRAFSLRMLLPNTVAVAVNYALFSRLFRAQVPARFSAAHLPPAYTVVAHAGYFRWSLGTLGAVCVGYFVGPLFGVEPYVIGFAGAFVLALAGVSTGRVRASLAAEIPWSIFPFVAGLFIVVAAFQSMAAGVTSRLFSALPSAPWLAVPGAALITGISANLTNNLPAALLARDALIAAHAPLATVYGALLGSNIGPNVLATASLASMLVLARARRSGDAPSNWELLRVGLCVCPAVMAAASLALALTFLWPEN